MPARVLASVAGLALTHTVGKAVMTGLFTSRQAVPAHAEMRGPGGSAQVLRLVWQEMTSLRCYACDHRDDAVNRGLDDPAATLWMVMLAVQSLPYLATILTACISAPPTAAHPPRVPPWSQHQQPQTPSCPKRRERTKRRDL